MIRALVLWLLAFIPHRTIMRKGAPYLTRWYLLGGPRTPSKGGASRWARFNLFLHCFHASDEPPAHNHPWSWSRSLILKGAYDEIRVLDESPHLTVRQLRRYRAGSISRIAADDFHYVTLLTPDVWTLFLAGPVVQSWGFLDGN